MGMVDAMMALGMLLGTLCSSFVFEAGGYVLIYGLDLLINILACLYARFIIRESIPENLADVSSYLVPTYVTVTVSVNRLTGADIHVRKHQEHVQGYV